MKNELQRRMKRDRIRWAIASILFVLMIVLLTGLILQVFGTGKVKPSEWFKKSDSEQTEQLTDMGDSNVKKLKIATTYATSSATPLCEHISLTMSNPLGGSGTATLYDSRNIRLSIKDIVSGSSLWSISCNFAEYNYSSGVLGGEYLTYFVFCIHDYNQKQAQNGYGIKNFSIDWNNGDLTLFKDYRAIGNGTFLESYNEANDTLRLEFGVGYSGIQKHFEDSYICTIFKARKVLPLPADPVKEGHTFVGWYYDSAFTQPYDGAPIYSDTQLYAKFEINTYMVSFNSDGGSEVASQTVNWNTAATLITPTRAKYAFKGWYLPNGTQYTNQPIKSNTTLTAHWERNVFNVTFNTDGGTAVANTEVNLNTTISLPTTTKTGYDFKGWFLSDGTQYTNQPVTGDLALTAHWEIQTFTVMFYVDGEVYATKTVEYGQSLIKVAEAVNLKMLSVRMVSGAPTTDENGAVIVTEDCSVEAQEMSNTDKAINTMKNNKWAIVGGVAGGVVLIAVIALICSTKRKRRR